MESKFAYDSGHYISFVIIQHYASKFLAFILSGSLASVPVLREIFFATSTVQLNKDIHAEMWLVNPSTLHVIMGGNGLNTLVFTGNQKLPWKTQACDNLPGLEPRLSLSAWEPRDIMGTPFVVSIFHQLGAWPSRLGA